MQRRVIYTPNQVQYIKAIDVWVKNGSPSDGDIWEGFQKRWNALTKQEQAQISLATSRDLDAAVGDDEIIGD